MTKRLNSPPVLGKRSRISGAGVLRRFGLWIIVSCFCLAATAVSAQPADPPEGSAKIRFDLSRLNDSGLRGPPDGLRALDYEFCIPSGERYVQEVKAIDPSAAVYSRSPGRIGCTEDQNLVIGNTHQLDFQEVLRELAALPYVARIDEAFFE